MGTPLYRAGSFKLNISRHTGHPIPSQMGAEGSSAHSHSWHEWSAKWLVPQVDCSVKAYV